MSGFVAHDFENILWGFVMQDCAELFFFFFFFCVDQELPRHFAEFE